MAGAVRFYCLTGSERQRWQQQPGIMAGPCEYFGGQIHHKAEPYVVHGIAKCLTLQGWGQSGVQWRC